MAVDPFARFLSDLGRAPNETAKRELFLTLAATGFDDRDFATELALGAEHGVRFSQSGLVRRGAIDSFYGSLVIEFEHDLRRTGRHALEQLRTYVAGAWRQDGSTDRPYLAVATDGARWQILTPRAAHTAADIDADDVALELVETWEPAGEAGDGESLRAFLNRLFFRRVPLAPTAANFVRDFGLQSPAFHRAAADLAAKLGELAADGAVRVKRQVWHDALQVAYGSVETDDALFAKHTYLAVLARLLVWAALERRALPDRELPRVLDGTYFEARRIANLVEEDFFRWHETPSLTDASRTWLALARHLSGYDLAAVREDVLKPLYEELVDPAFRQVLGEFYTPDWLASQLTERLLEGWDWTGGAPSVIDPACGSGTFLRTSILEVRRRFEEAGRQPAIEDVTGAIVGIDVHPLAVTIAKATYLLAVRDLIARDGPPVSLPVYLANSLRPETDDAPTLFGLDRIELRIGQHRYLVPTEFVRNGPIYDDAIDEVVRIARSFGRPDTDLDDAAPALVARLGGRLATLPVADALTRMLGAMARDLAALIRAREDSVHGFMLKNNLRPAMLRRSFDYVIGNPPWLTVGDIASSEYKDLVVEIATRGAIAPRAGGDLAHTELATLFLADAAQELIRDGAPADRVSIGLVMPRSLFVAGHHRLLRNGTYRPQFRIVEVWDLEGVEPLFRVPSCVVLATRQRPDPLAPMRGREYAGRLPAKDVTWAEAQPHLTVDDCAYRLAFLAERSAWVRIGGEADTLGGFGPTAGANPYEAGFEQGAVLYPQTLLTVVGDGTPLRRGLRAVVVRPDPSAGRNAKLLADVDFRLTVDSDNLYSTAAAEHLLPYTLLEPLWTVVLPTLTDPGDLAFRLVGSPELRRAGRVETAAWLDWANGLWAGVRKEGETADLPDRLDYMGHLRSQARRGRYLVLYTSSGTRAVAAVLDAHQVDPPFVARDNTYWASFDDLQEADFVTGFLNSDLVSARIEAWQTRGLFGARHVHKRPLSIPWPAYDRLNGVHRELAAAAGGLREEARARRPELPITSIGRVRVALRALLPAASLLTVERCVASLADARAADLLDHIGHGPGRHQ